MQHRFVPRLVFAAQVLASVVTFVAVPRIHASDPFTKPTAEELAMTSLPEYPGASAVVLSRDEQTKDDLHVAQHHERIKILTEAGKKYANVELMIPSYRDTYYNVSDQASISDITGRTIHPNGSIIPFTAKPLLKTIESSEEGKLQQIVFALPDVTVGSILEYKYSRRISDDFFEAPAWYIQGPLYVKSARYLWIPSQFIRDAISWFPVLPPGVDVKATFIPAASIYSAAMTSYELTMHDIPPVTEEDHMPPVEDFSYRVFFNVSRYRSPEDYWTNAGKQWSKEVVDSFVGSRSSVAAYAAEMTAGTSTDEDKLRRIYAAIMQFENTRYTRDRDSREEKVRSASDVISHKRGTPKQLNDAFIALARASGFQAYAVLVPDRAKTIFVSQWLSFRQFTGELTIVVIKGKEHYFDPGTRYCPFGQLGWEHTLVSGLRQTATGVEFIITPMNSYKTNKTTRVANLAIDDHGAVSGKLDISFYGASALRWRQRALSGDAESLRSSLEVELQHMIPGSLNVKELKVQNMDEYEKPLIVNAITEGTIGTPTGKRIVLPADLFSVGETTAFTSDKRDLAVDLHYPEAVIDAIRINLPKAYAVEAVPDATDLKWKDEGLYSLTAISTPGNITVRRSFVMDEVIVPTKEYAGFHGFYAQLQASDKSDLVLETSAVQK